jgi:hypothetical protein
VNTTGAKRACWLLDAVLFHDEYFWPGLSHVVCRYPERKSYPVESDEDVPATCCIRQTFVKGLATLYMEPEGNHRNIGI